MVRRRTLSRVTDICIYKAVVYKYIYDTDGYCRIRQTVSFEWHGRSWSGGNFVKLQKVRQHS